MKMLEFGIKTSDLAERTGYAIGTVYNLLAETSKSIRGRKKIEEILGPIWTATAADPAETLSDAPEAPSATPPTNSDTTKTTLVPC